MAAPRSEPFADERQPILFDDLPVPPPRRSDERALADARAIVDELTRSKTNPWSERQDGWQRRRFAALAQLLTPIEAAVLTANFAAELKRVGPPIDIWAKLDERPQT